MESRLSAQYLSDMGDPRHRLDGFGQECPASTLLLPSPGPTSLGPGCPNQTLGIPTSLYFLPLMLELKVLLSPEDPEG